MSQSPSITKHPEKVQKIKELLKESLRENLEFWETHHGELPSPFKEIHAGQKVTHISQDTLPKFEYNLLHMAVLLQDEHLTNELAKLNLLNLLIKEPDAFGFTPLHYMYIANPNLSNLPHLLSIQVNDVPRDFFLGSPQDYHNILNPSSPRDRNRKCIKLFSTQANEITQISIAELESTFDITYTLTVHFSIEFLHQILTTAYEVNKNEEHSLKYGSFVDSIQSYV